LGDSNTIHNAVDIHTKGGQLKVSFEKIDGTYRNIWLTGPATRVFVGKIEI
jgi:diaminopimelate epimerase